MDKSNPEEAATKIQKNFREHLYRRRSASVATRIQKHSRGYLLRLLRRNSIASQYLSDNILTI